MTATIIIVIFRHVSNKKVSQVSLAVKNLLASAGDIKETQVGEIPGLGRSPGGGHSNPLQYSCLENPMDRGAWWDMAHGVAKTWTQLKHISMRNKKNEHQR